jgi:hypothetical protein
MAARRVDERAKLDPAVCGCCVAGHAPAWPWASTLVRAHQGVQPRVMRNDLLQRVQLATRASQQCRRRLHESASAPWPSSVEAHQ